MELEIITEREGSPFRHIFSEQHGNGRRYGQNLDNMQKVMREFLDSLGLNQNVKTLEVGAGHGQEPSKALLALGSKPFTLDADWNSYCTDIPKVEDLDKLGEAQIYPMLAGRNGVTHYLGDIAFIGDERSQLRNERFNLLFYWGSIHGTGFCSSIQQSRTTTDDFHNEIPLSDRLLAPIPNLSDGGCMAYISGFFNRTGDPSLHPKNVVCFNGDMVDTLLLWTNHQSIVPKKVIIFGLNPDFSFDYLKKIIPKEIFEGNKITAEEIKQAVDNDTIAKFMENHWSMFSDYKSKDSTGYQRALEVFNQEQQKRISSLGLIDCVAVQY